MSIYDEHEPEISAGKYFKPEDGKIYSLRVASEPVIFDNVFNGPKGTQISTRYAWIVYNYTTKLAQIWQLPPTGYKKIRELAMNPKWGDPTSGKYDLDYKRTGTSLDTEHSIIPVPGEGALTEDQQKEVDGIDLLESISAGKGAERVQWLKDAMKGRPAREKAEDEAMQGGKTDDVVIEDIGDEPINLDDIPF